MRKTKNSINDLLSRRVEDWNNNILPMYERFIKYEVGPTPFFGTVNFLYNLNQYNAARFCSNIHQQLVKSYMSPENNDKWPMFFAIELNGCRPGYHIHFVAKSHPRASAIRIEKILRKARFMNEGMKSKSFNRKSIIVKVENSPTNRCIGYVLKDEIFYDHESLFKDFDFKTNTN